MGQDLFLKKSAVMGGGLMGSQITLVLALGSVETVLMSRRQETVDKAMDNIRRYAADLERHDQLNGETAAAVVGRIRTATDVEDAVAEAEFVVESISENLEGKQALFEAMDSIAPRETVLASNTSGLPITILGARMVHQDRIGGSHFVQPGHIVPVVEVIRGDKTSDATMDRSCEVWERLGRITLRVQKDGPGFLINRLQHAIIREAVHLLVTGVADAESIDLAVELGLAPRFTTAGPLKQRDINGLKMHVNVATHLWKELGGWETPLAYLQAMVERGDTGLDAGKGYYDWSGQDPTAVRSEKDEELIRRTEQVMADWHARKKS
jgi:3-hydroxybutyryl-CoA dehydrogenase